MREPIRNYTEICLKDGNGIYTIQVDKTGMSCQELVNDVVRSVLLAAGFAEASVDAVLGPYGSERVDEPCEYQTDLNKILDALHANNAKEAIATINDLKGLSAAYYSYKSDLRKLLDISDNISAFAHIRHLKDRAAFCDHLAEDIDATNPHRHSTVILIRDGKVFKVERTK